MKTKYIVGKCGFTSKKHLVDYTKQTLKKHYNRNISDDEKKFIIELIYQHPESESFGTISTFNVESNKTLSLYITVGSDVLDISYLKCIDNVVMIEDGKVAPFVIPFQDVIDEVVNFEFSFGKFDGHTVEWVYENHPEYLNWLLSDNFDETKARIKFRIKRYLSFIGIYKEPNNTLNNKYTKENLAEAINIENYELAIIIRDYLNQP